MTQTERDLRPHFIQPIDHDQERRIFEEEWGTDHHHHQVQFAPGHQTDRIHSYEHVHPTTARLVAPHVRKHTDYERFEMEGRHAVREPEPVV